MRLSWAAFLMVGGCLGQVTNGGSADEDLRRRHSQMAADMAVAPDLASTPDLSSTTPPPPGCGNGVTDPGEACDGANLNGFSCAGSFAGFTGGTLRCKPDCSGFVLTGCVPGRTIAAASCNQTDVGNAIASASDGDTVTVPAGTCTWSTTLSVTKSIVLQGAGGQNGTTFYNTGGTILQVRPATDKPVRVTGIRFDQHNTELQFVVSIVGKATHVRFDHVWFETGDWGIGWNSLGWVASGPVYGVIDHSTFHNMKRGLSPGDLRAGDAIARIDGSTAWQEPIVAGSLANMYVEDNAFLYDAAYPASLYAAGGDASIYANPYGGTAAIRKNQFTGYVGNYVDAHGDANGSDSTKFYEVYDNTFSWGPYGTCCAASFADQRGGSWLIWGNTIIGGPGLVLSNYYGINGHPVKDTFIWNNDYAHTLVSIYSNPAGYVTPDPVLDRDYFLHAPQPGQRFYPYTPAVYPHPLVTP